MATVITVTLRKGGSGKTTTAVNLASSLAKHGKKVSTSAVIRTAIEKYLKTGKL